MKVDELRALAEDELGDRMRAARRELYELRFKHAVGQLENSSQISKVRHDIARIMTVLRERDFGILTSPPTAGVPALERGSGRSAGGEGPSTVAVDEGFEPIEDAPAEEAKPKRGRKAKEEA